LKKGIQATDPVPGDIDKWPRVHNISFKNVSVQDVAELVDGTNIPSVRPLDGFTLSDITGTCGRAITIANMTNVIFSKIHVSGFEGPLVMAQNVKGTGLDGAAAQ